MYLNDAFNSLKRHGKQNNIRQVIESHNKFLYCMLFGCRCTIQKILCYILFDVLMY